MTLSTTRASQPQLPPCDHQPRAYEGPTRDEVLAKRLRYVNPGIFTYYREPLMPVEGRGQYVWDETGRRYLDLFAGIVTVGCGHCHPHVTARIVEQLSRLQHSTTIYLHPNLPSFAEKLVDTLPSGLDTVYFTNSGSEANDLATAMARLHTGRDDIVALRGGYHGGVASAMGLTSLSTWKFASQQGGRVHHAVNPDPYRSPFSGTPEEIASKSAEDIRDLIRFSTPGEIAAFLAEPIMGAGGVYCGAENYLREAYEVARQHGGLCIADEVQTGFGRCGSHFWGFETFGVVPDIVTMAKGIGNGLPLAAVVTRREIAETLTRRIHFNTFGGNPVVMAAGEAVLEVIAEERLQERCLTLGRRFRDGLRELAGRHPLVGDVRGKGLMIGVELVSDRTTKEPATAATAAVLEHARELGLLLGKGGLWGNVLRIKPPMVLGEADVDFALEVLDLALAHAASA